MKIRNGFISNSSSSSFIIISKKGEINKNSLLEMLKVPKESLCYPIAKELVEVLINNSTKVTLKDLLKNYGAKNIKDLPNYMQKALEEKGIIYEGSVGSEAEGLEVGLVDADIDFEDENIIVKKEGGY